MTDTPTRIEKARKNFEHWAECTMEYTPPHMCEAGEPDPQPELCIPCNMIESGREYVAAVRAEQPLSKSENHWRQKYFKLKGDKLHLVEQHGKPGGS